MRDIRSNIPFCLQEFPQASPLGNPSGEGLYLTVYPLSRPNTDTVFLVSMYLDLSEKIYCHFSHIETLTQTSSRAILELLH